MEGYFQAAGAVLITLILTMMLSARDKSYAAILSMAVCAMLLLLGMRYLEPVIAFLRELEALGNLQTDLVRILFKAAGIGILTELAALLCTDSGNGSLAQGLRILSTAVILWLSLPVFQALLELIQGILEGV